MCSGVFAGLGRQGAVSAGLFAFQWARCPSVIAPQSSRQCYAMPCVEQHRAPSASRRLRWCSFLELGCWGISAEFGGHLRVHCMWRTSSQVSLRYGSAWLACRILRHLYPECDLQWCPYEVWDQSICLCQSWADILQVLLECSSGAVRACEGHSSVDCMQRFSVTSCM